MNRGIVLLSIKPEYVKEIYSGKKRFEFRKKIGKDLKPGDIVYIYETLPTKKITGCFIVGSITVGFVSEIHEIAFDKGGVGIVDFLDYFEREKSDMTPVYAIGICAVQKFRDPEPIPDGITVPQNFCYIKKREHIQLLSGKKSVMVLPHKDFV